jgi:hypothetical protein
METDPVMTACHASAFQALPLFRFLFQKALNAVLFYIYQVAYRAHVIKSTVPLVERFKSPAGKISTLIAEADKPFTQQFAVSAHVYAIPAPRTATGTIRLLKTLLFQVVLHCQIVRTHSAVDPAGSNQFFTHIP